MSGSRHELVHRLFTDAVALPGDDARACFLDERCNGDPDLRAAVVAMLDADAQADGTLDAAIDEGGARFLAGVLARDGAIDELAPDLPERFGKYRIVRRIGEGGMGVVYEAEQDDPRRRVALKVVRTSLVTRGLLRRFRHETRVLGLLRHPGIAQIYEAGSADSGHGGQPYFAMELVEGATITDYAASHDLDTNARLALLAQLCDIIEHAHQKGVIHRDIKPANVLVAAELSGTAATRNQPLLKVLDFGVARATDADLNTVTLRTTMGQLIGTVPYMSPEQASGDPAGIDTRSDVYSVGVLGWELLTGRLPYDVRGKMVHEAVRVIREEEPSRLSDVDRALRGDVETILAKALEKEKDRRYQSAADLAADIRRHLAHEPIAARPASTLYQLRKFARRNKTLVGGVASSLLIALVGAGVSARFAWTASHRADALERTSYVAGLAAASAALDQHEFAAATDLLDALPTAPRGWEHDHLRARLETHDREWETPAPVASGRKHGAPVFDPPGRRMFAVMADRSIGVWDVATGRFVRSIDYPRLEGTLDASLTEPYADWSVVMHGPTMRFAANTPDGLLAVHDLETGARLETIPSSVGFGAMAWDAAGRQLLHRDVPGESLRIWDGRESRVVVDSIAAAHGVFDPAGDRIVETYEDSISSFDRGSGERRVTSRNLMDRFMLRYSAGGELAALGFYGNDYLLDGRTLEVLAQLQLHRGDVTGAAWVTTDGGEVLVTADRRGSLGVWDRAGGRTVELHATGMQGATTVGVLPGDRSVVVAGEGVRSFPLDDPRVLRGHASFVYGLAFSPDGALLASSGFLEETIHVWDVATGRPVAALPAPSLRYGNGGLLSMGVAPALAFSADGRRMVAASMDETRQWAVPGFAPLPVAETEEYYQRFVDTLGHLPRYGYHGIARSPDGRTFADVRRQDAGPATVGIFDAESCGPLEPPTSERGYREPRRDAAPIGSLAGHEDRVFCVTWSPDGTRLATGGDDGTVRLWDARTFDQLLVLRGHESYVMDVAFSPDGTLLASASGDRTVRLWDTLPLHERRARAADR